MGRHEGAAVLLPGFAIKWEQKKVTRQPHLGDLTHMSFMRHFCYVLKQIYCYNHFVQESMS